MTRKPRFVSRSSVSVKNVLVDHLVNQGNCGYKLGGTLLFIAKRNCLPKLLDLSTQAAAAAPVRCPAFFVLPHSLLC